MPEDDKLPLRAFADGFTTHVSALVRLLTALREAFDGDLDTLLIFAVIGDRHFARRVDPNTPTYRTLGSTEVSDTPSVNAFSIAQCTGIPRETARRKVAQLVERGWVTNDASGNLRPTRRAARELAKGTDETIRFINTISALKGPLDKR